MRKARLDADDLRGRSAEEVRALREQAAQSAAVCADCFMPLPPTASVTMVGRRIVVPPSTDWRGAPVPERTKWLTVPICLTCWLIHLQQEAADWRGIDQHRHELYATKSVQRLRCEGCGRPMRVYHPRHYRRGLHHSERVCCADCARKASNARNRLRRQVKHQEIEWAVCGERFKPKRSDAVTCSNRCRQQLFRQRAAQQPAT